MTSFFPNHRFVGFDHLFDELERASREKPQGYPPYNIIKESEENAVIQIAVAGFDINELDITVKENLLVISGENKNEENNYLYKGISTRNFERKFRLHEHAEVDRATLVNGILSVHITTRIPEEKKPRKISIAPVPSFTQIPQQESSPVFLTENVVGGAGADQAFDNTMASPH